MAAFTYDAINAQGIELSGEIHAPDLAAAREQLQTRGLLPHSLSERTTRRAGGARTALQDATPEEPPGLLPPAGDDDRGRRQRCRRSRHAGGTDGGQVPPRGHRRDPV